MSVAENQCSSLRFVDVLPLEQRREVNLAGKFRCRHDAHRVGVDHEIDVADRRVR